MKKIFKTLAIVAVAALGFACQNDIDEQVNGNEGEKVTVEVVASTPAGTRSSFGEKEGNAYTSTWSKDQVVYFAPYQPAEGNITMSEAVVAEASATASFEIEFTNTQEEGAIYAFSPKGERDVKGGFTQNLVYANADPYIWLNVPAEQTTSATSCDEQVHVLYASKEYSGGFPTSVSMDFNHVLAYGKMNITNFAGGEIASVAITFPEAVAGGSVKYYYLTNTFDGASAETITVNNVDDNATIWFGIVPTESGEEKMSGNMTVVVTDSEGKTYTKPLATTGKLAFIQGQVSNFTVNMEGIDADEKVVYNGLTADEIAAALNKAGLGGYGLVTFDSSCGDWVGYVYGKNSDKVLQMNDSQSYYYLESPVFDKYVESVDITFTANTTIDRSIYAVAVDANHEYSIANAYGSVTTTEKKEQTLTLNFNASTKQFALLAQGGAVYISNIEVNLTDVAIIPTLPTPVVTATANGNAITVSWEAIDGAANYTVTWDGGTQTVDGTECTFEDLDYSTNYTFEVVANTEDANVNKSSLAGTATATTAIDPAEATKNYSKMTSWEADLDGKYLLVVESKNKYLTSVSDGIGNGSDITITNNSILGTAVAESAILSLEEGNSEGTYSFKMGNVYLALTANDNKLHTSATKTNNSSWTISIADGNATITNVEYNTRKLQWNAGSPRFACYTSVQTAIQIYKRDAAPDNRADASLSFDAMTAEATLNSDFDAPTLTFNDNEVNSVVDGLTFSSSNPSIAEVDNVGVVTLKASGETTITATFAGNEDYKPATASYTLTVNPDPNAANKPVTVTMSSFSAISANMDTVISYACAKGNGTSNPAINGGVIRLYQNSSGKGGGNITITAKTGYKIQSITIGSSMNTTLGYGVDSDTATVTNVLLAANGKHTLSDLSAESVSFHCYGTTSSTRLYVNYLSVTYVAE